VRAQYGGLRTRIAKRKKHPTPEERARVINQALDQGQADVPTDQIAESNGISRRTLYRYLKRGVR
jgi:AcrR family transcriptional regulator